MKYQVIFASSCEDGYAWCSFESEALSYEEAKKLFNMLSCLRPADEYDVELTIRTYREKKL